MYLTIQYLCMHILRLQHEVSLLQQQLCESRALIHSLQSELQVYDRVCSSTKASKGQNIYCKFRFKQKTFNLLIYYF